VRDWRDFVTVVSTASFLRGAKGLLSEVQMNEIIDHLGLDPTVGDVIEGTGGVRKVRFGLDGRGKRGGVRVIYFFHADWLPVYLLDVYAKNEKDDLSPDEKAELKSLVKKLVEIHRRVKEVRQEN
jgi:hypothetical protein